MLATIGWSRRGASEVKLYSPEDNNNDKNNNSNGTIGYAEASCSSSSSKNGEKRNSKIQSNEINCVEWSKSNGNCVAIGLSDGRVVVLDKQLQCVGEVKEEERKREEAERREKMKRLEAEEEALAARLVLPALRGCQRSRCHEESQQAPHVCMYVCYHPRHRRP